VSLRGIGKRLKNSLKGAPVVTDCSSVIPVSLLDLTHLDQRVGGRWPDLQGASVVSKSDRSCPIDFHPDTRVVVGHEAVGIDFESIGKEPVLRPPVRQGGTGSEKEEPKDRRANGIGPRRGSSEQEPSERERGRQESEVGVSIRYGGVVFKRERNQAGSCQEGRDPDYERQNQRP